MKKKPRIKVCQQWGGLVIRNTQIQLQEPGYWVDGRWQPCIGEEMKKFKELKTYLEEGEWYVNFWKRRGKEPPPLLPGL